LIAGGIKAELRVFDNVVGGIFVLQEYQSPRELLPIEQPHVHCDLQRIHGSHASRYGRAEPAYLAGLRFARTVAEDDSLIIFELPLIRIPQA
jgi:hypothetical protein